MDITYKPGGEGYTHVYMNSSKIGTIEHEHDWFGEKTVYYFHNELDPCQSEFGDTLEQVKNKIHRGFGSRIFRTIEESRIRIFKNLIH